MLSLRLRVLSFCETSMLSIWHTLIKLVRLLNINYTQYAINIEHLKRIAEEISKPIRNHNTLDYIPTQYISDYIKSKGYDGIEYVSVMSDTGKNLAIFNP